MTVTSGEREHSMFSKGTVRGRTHYRFEPSALMFWLSLFAAMGGFFTGMRYIVFLDLRPTVRQWMIEDFASELNDHKNFATKTDLANIARSVDIRNDEFQRMTMEMRAELIYLRSRVDSIADKVGAK